MSEDSSRADRELSRLRAATDEQQREIARLREEAAEASSELAQLGVDAEEHRRHDRAMEALVERLRSDARVRDDVIARQLEQLAADELELNDLRAIRDALTPPALVSRPGVVLAASFVPAAEGVSGDFYLVAEGPDDTTALIVGDVVGKGLAAARRAAFTRTVFSTTAPFSDDPTQLLSWANTALLERTAGGVDFVTVGCVTFSPSERILRWAYAGHPPVLWLDSGEELTGGRAPPLGLTRDWTCTTAADRRAPGAGVLLYTDGVTEARRDGELFGNTRLAQSIQALGGRPPRKWWRRSRQTSGSSQRPGSPTTCASSRRGSTRADEAYMGESANSDLHAQPLTNRFATSPAGRPARQNGRRHRSLP